MSAVKDAIIILEKSIFAVKRNNIKYFIYSFLIVVLLILSYLPSILSDPKFHLVGERYLFGIICIADQAVYCILIQSCSNCKALTNFFSVPGHWTSISTACLDRFVGCKLSHGCFVQQKRSQCVTRKLEATEPHFKPWSRELKEAIGE